MKEKFKLFEIILNTIVIIQILMYGIFIGADAIDSIIHPRTSFGEVSIVIFILLVIVVIGNTIILAKQYSKTIVLRDEKYLESVGYKLGIMSLLNLPVGIFIMYYIDNAISVVQGMLTILVSIIVPTSFFLYFHNKINKDKIKGIIDGFLKGIVFTVELILVIPFILFCLGIVWEIVMLVGILLTQK